MNDTEARLVAAIRDAIPRELELAVDGGYAEGVTSERSVTYYRVRNPGTFAPVATVRVSIGRGSFGLSAEGPAAPDLRRPTPPGVKPWTSQDRGWYLADELDEPVARLVAWLRGLAPGGIPTVTWYACGCGQSVPLTGRAGVDGARLEHHDRAHQPAVVA